MRGIVVAGLAAVLIAGGTAAAVWRADSGGGANPGSSFSGEDFPVTNQISCASVTSCLVVGSRARGAPATSVPVAQAFSAGNGRAVTVRSPGTQATLTGVSCPTASYCLAVGEYNPGASGNSLPFALAWNGTSLSPVARLPLPRSTDLDAIGGVSCPAANRCVVTGATSGPGSGGGELVWTWNGTAFSGLSCVSGDRCTAVGLGYASHQSPITSFLDVWNGRTWKLTRWRGPKGSGDAELSAVSCVSASDCVAVGSDGPDTDQRADALAWNGSTWTAAAVPGPGAGRMSLFDGVTCAKAGSCIAIGEEGKSGLPIVDLTGTASIAGQWNGTAWQVTAS